MTPKRRYKKPLIVEAICEFHFKASREWDPTVFGRYYERIRAEFPKKDTEKSPSPLWPPWGLKSKSYSKMFFRRTDGSALVQVGENDVTVNAFPPYPGWHNLKTVVFECVRQYAQVSEEEKIRRLAVRYINMFPATGKMRLSDVLAISPYIPQSVREADHPLSLWLSQSLGRDQKLRLDITFSPSGWPKDWTGTAQEQDQLVVDIECSRQADEGLDLAAVEEALEEAHGAVLDLFEGLITDHVRRFMEEV